MPSEVLTQDECHAVILAFLRDHLGTVHRDDVGPLFGQLAIISSWMQPDPASRQHLARAVSAALGAGPYPSGFATITWTKAVVVPADRGAAQHGLRAPIGQRRLLARGTGARRGPR